MEGGYTTVFFFCYIGYIEEKRKHPAGQKGLLRIPEEKSMARHYAAGGC